MTEQTDRSLEERVDLLHEIIDVLMALAVQNFDGGGVEMFDALSPSAQDILDRWAVARLGDLAPPN
jgi:hypothetical protein